MGKATRGRWVVEGTSIHRLSCRMGSSPATFQFLLVGSPSLGPSPPSMIRIDSFFKNFGGIWINGDMIS